MKRALLATLTVLMGAAIVAGSVVFLSDDESEPPALVAKVIGTAQTPRGELPHATLEMSIYPASSASAPGPDAGVNAVYDDQGWPFYAPSTTLELPANSLVTMTVHQMDTGGQIYNPWLADVTGTVDGTADYDGTTKSGIDKNNVAHTFTIHQYPESTQPDFFVNVPFPAQANNAPNESNGYPKPLDITFSFITGAPGTYIWNCEFPCGSGYVAFGGPMQARGWMSGTVVVA